MINLLIYILFSSIFVFDWLFEVYGIGIRFVTWIPEIVSAVTAFYILVIAATHEKINIPIKYVILLLIYFLHICMGLFLNDVPLGTILAGIRTYFKFIPLFLLPAVFKFEDASMKKVLMFILALACMQLPIVIWQRFFEFKEVLSGDPMGGTLGYGASGLLSIFLICVISFLIAFYLMEKISLRFFLISICIVFLPTTLNETKVTFVLLPLAFIFPLIFLKKQRKTIMKAVFLIVLFSVIGFTLKNIYDHFQMKRWGHGITGFITEQSRVENYMAERIDPIFYAIDKALRGPQILFGHGVGNVSISFTKAMTGKYSREAEMYKVGEVSITKLFWEIGILGTLIFFLLVLMIFWDAIKLCKRSDFIGTFSLGMLTLITIFALSFFYTSTIDLNLLVFLFFFLGGYTVSYSKSEQNKEFPSESNPSCLGLLER